jgi:serine/threonine-protein kinase
MSPEQIQSARTVDHRADIYALGIILHEMLTGERPFKGSSAQVLFAHIQQPAPDPRKIVPEIPANVAQAIVRAMAKDPDDRYQSAGELVEALQT